MKFPSSVTVLVGATICVAQALFDQWSPPGPGDVRGPCPMLNTLANHDFLPHDGTNIDTERVVHALQTALNMEKVFITFLFGFALQTNPEPNATWVDLDHLNRHNLLEHDASLSRQDDFFGPTDVFNATIFAETQSYWGSSTITLEEAARARVARFHNSIENNPEYTMSTCGRLFSAGETVGYIEIFGSLETLTAPRNLVAYFFENERLPTELGWKRSSKVITKQFHDNLMDMLHEITREIDPSLAEGPSHAR